MPKAAWDDPEASIILETRRNSENIFDAENKYDIVSAVTIPTNSYWYWKILEN